MKEYITELLGGNHRPANDKLPLWWFPRMQMSMDQAGNSHSQPQLCYVIGAEENSVWIVPDITRDDGTSMTDRNTKVSDCMIALVGRLHIRTMLMESVTVWRDRQSMLMAGKMSGDERLPKIVNGLNEASTGIDPAHSTTHIRRMSLKSAMLKVVAEGPIIAAHPDGLGSWLCVIDTGSWLCVIDTGSGQIERVLKTEEYNKLPYEQFTAILDVSVYPNGPAPAFKQACSVCGNTFLVDDLQEIGPKSYCKFCARGNH